MVLLGLSPLDVYAAEPSYTVQIDVDVDPSIVEAAELAQWVKQEGYKALAAVPDGSALRGELLINISGVLYDYQVTIDALREGEAVEGSTWPCECSNEDLLNELRSGMSRAFTSLREADAAGTNVEKTPAPIEGTPSWVARYGPVGWTGVGVMSAGGVALVTGVVLLLVGEQRTDSLEDLGMDRVMDYRPPGAVLLGSGAGLLLTGGVLFLFRKRQGQGPRPRVEAVAPGLDRRGAFMTVRGRF